MKAITVLILLSLLSFQVEANKGVSLNEAVNQVKSEGRVLSARTVNGRHEIKVLTPNGTVKTVNKKAASTTNNSNQFNLAPQSNSRSYSRFDVPNSHSNSRESLQLKERNQPSRSKSSRQFKRNDRNNRKTSSNKTSEKKKNNTNSKDNK